MRYIFCADPLTPAAPDPAFAAEVAAVERAGGSYDLIHFERLVDDHSPLAATRRVRAADPPELAIYRGWMLRPEQYAQLYAALQNKGLRLINSPAAYRHCHYLPDSYPIIAEVTPRSVWLPYDASVTIDQVMALLAPFGDRPVILKDYVKSRKHEWHEACYIPSASDRRAVERVVRRFVGLQGTDLNEGLVFREYRSFEPIGSHRQSGMPLTLEFRCFVLDGSVLATSAYWEEGADSAITPPAALFAPLLAQVQSRFFTLDIARQMDGTWLVVELGDAQVAGLPEPLDPTLFYARLVERLGGGD
ncbi:MAG: ATP-grasp domain-containing protein [Herpetosiphonaceae bacterium]|nr:ATP-grasp domain-containing protein [Herpetosiphonaceae bacterium]